jgi:uncharacterized protein with von Willebrand factor type A (vWA) domain
MTNPDYTDIIVVLDRSGSMHAIKEDTESGFATFIADQRALGGDARVTLVQFDDAYEVVYTARRIEDVPTLELRPRGSTALLDALGRTITAAGERLAAMAEDDRPGYVVVLTMTDGMDPGEGLRGRQAANRRLRLEVHFHGGQPGRDRRRCEDGL